MQHQEPDLSLTLDTRSRHLDNNHDCVTQDDESEHTVLDTHRRVWEADRHASECRRCNRRFNFLVRRHHCRRCGLVVCDRCSSHRIRLPPNEIIQDPAVDPSHYPLIAMHPQRVCDACVRLPIKEIPSSSMSSNTRRRATAPVTMRRSGSSQSLMSECPVCGHDLLGMAKKDQENHLQMCLNAGSPPVRPPRYLGKGKQKGMWIRH
ncbi:FYVE-domain-containing protein [Lichtheimia hyalospora FSU 10163]|nr:FYVE-domain-containing protein [Lichtheimia hyalospora FSU 10163]